MIKILLLAVVPFITQHRNVAPKTEVSTNFYGSVTGIVDKAYIEARVGAGGGGCDTNAVDILANSAVVTNALTVATTNRVALLESSKADKSALAAHVANINNPHAVTAAQVGAVPKVLKAVDSDLTVRELNDKGDIIIKGQDGSDVLQVTVGKEDNNYTSSIYVDDFVDLTIGGVRSWGEYGLSSSAKKKLDVSTFTSTSNKFARKLVELENTDVSNFDALDDKINDIKYIARAFTVWKTNNYVAAGKDADGYALKDGQVTRDSQVAIGEGAKAVEDRAVAIGKQSRASGVDSVAVGNKASSNGRGTVVIGNATAIAGQDRAVVIGSIGDNKLTSNGSDTFTVSAEDLTKFYFRDKTLKSLIDDNLPTNAASKAEMEEMKSALAAHVANTNNPHAVTAAQVGAVPLVEDANGEKTAVTIGSRRSDESVGAHSFANGDGVAASIYYSHAEGSGTTAYGPYSHAEGVTTIASGDNSHSEGNSTTASGMNSHAEGESTAASGAASHAEGGLTTASGDYSHAEGTDTTASGYGSHAEGVVSETREEDSFAFAWNGDSIRPVPYTSHGAGTFNINPDGGLNGFWIGEQTLASILTNKADKADISAENQTFSNAVLAVGLNIDTNSVAVLNDIAATFGGFPLGAGETATTVGGLLAALAAAVAWLKKNKVQTLKLADNSVETSADGGVAKLDDFFTNSNGLLNGRLAYSRNATGLKDRAFNALTFDGTEYNLSTVLAAVTPTASGQPRDLLIVATATAATTISFTAGTIKGDKPTIDGSGTWLITLTEYASGVWYCRQIKMEDAA